jgi:hypothetical protein
VAASLIEIVLVLPGDSQDPEEYVVAWPAVPRVGEEVYFDPDDSFGFEGYYMVREVAWRALSRDRTRATVHLDSVQAYYGP